MKFIRRNLLNMCKITCHPHFVASFNAEDTLFSRSNVDKDIPYDKEWKESVVNLPRMTNMAGIQHD